MQNLLKFSSQFGLSDEEKGYFQQIIGIETTLKLMTEEAGKQVGMRRASIASRVVYHLLLTLRSFADGAQMDYLISPIIHSVVSDKLLYTDDKDLLFRNQNSFSVSISELEKLGYKTQGEFATRLNEIWSEYAKITFDKHAVIADDWRFYIELVY